MRHDSGGPGMTIRVVVMLGLLAVGLAAGVSSGRLTQPGPLIWILGLIGLQAVRIPAIVQRARAQTQQNVSGRRDTLAVIAYSIGVFAVPIFWATGVLPSLAPAHQPVWTIIPGALAALSAIILCWRSHRDLKEQWSSGLELIAGHRLVTTGVYARIRHPMYLAFVLSAATQALLLPDLVAGLAGLVGVALMLMLRLPLEERMLASAFGARWEAHRAATGALWPKLG